MEKSLATPLYQVLQQTIATLLVVSDGGVFDHNDCFDWILGTDQEVL
jgi:hypothetical protein